MLDITPKDFDSYEDAVYDLKELVSDTYDIDFHEVENKLNYVHGNDLDDAVEYAIQFTCDTKGVTETKRKRKLLRGWLSDAEAFGCDVMDISANLVERQLGGERITEHNVRAELDELVDRVVELADAGDWWHNERAMCVA
jgi:hypothetical protein